MTPLDYVREQWAGWLVQYPGQWLAGGDCTALGDQLPDLTVLASAPTEENLFAGLRAAGIRSLFEVPGKPW